MKNLIIAIFLLFTATGAMAQRKYIPPLTPEEQLSETYGIHLFRGVDGTWFDLQGDNATSGVIAYTNILDWLQGRVAGLQVYSFRNIRVPFLRARPTAIFLDEMRVDYSVLNDLSVADIGLVKVMTAPYAAGLNSPGGAIAIYTKRGEAAEEEES